MRACISGDRADGLDRLLIASAWSFGERRAPTVPLGVKASRSLSAIDSFGIVRAAPPPSARASQRGLHQPPCFTFVLRSKARHRGGKGCCRRRPPLHRVRALHRRTIRFPPQRPFFGWQSGRNPLTQNSRFCALLGGNRSKIKAADWTLTPPVLVRIQLPQPIEIVSIYASKAAGRWPSLHKSAVRHFKALRGAPRRSEPLLATFLQLG